MPQPLFPRPWSALALVLLASSAAAQSRNAKLIHVPRPVKSAHLDADTGVITRGSPTRPKSASTVSDFPNLDLGGFVGIDSGGSFCEWFNDGIKGVNHNASDLMTSF